MLWKNPGFILSGALFNITTWLKLWTILKTNRDISATMTGKLYVRSRIMEASHSLETFTIIYLWTFTSFSLIRIFINHHTHTHTSLRNTLYTEWFAVWVAGAIGIFLHSLTTLGNCKVCERIRIRRLIQIHPKIRNFECVNSRIATARCLFFSYEQRFIIRRVLQQLVRLSVRPAWTV